MVLAVGERQTARTTLHQGAVARVIEAMREELATTLSLDEMADIACFSPFHFNRMFKAITGIPPHQFLYALRLEHAKRLLISTDLSVTEICFEVGYNSLGSFTQRFTGLVGLSPNAFRALAADFKDFALSTIRDLIDTRNAPACDDNGHSVKLVLPNEFNGLIFVGVFRRAIPERRPLACLLNTSGGVVRLPKVPLDKFFVFSVALPWDSDAADVLTLENAFRGRSSQLPESAREVFCVPELRLLPFDDLHPPILLALPLLVSNKLNLKVEG